MNAEEFFEQEERKEKRKKRLRLLAIPLYYVIYIPSLILSRMAGNFTWEQLIGLLIPGIYYLMVFEAELLFEIKYGLNADVQNTEPTDLYFSASCIGGYAFMLLGLVLAILFYWSSWSSVK